MTATNLPTRSRQFLIVAALIVAVPCLLLCVRPAGAAPLHPAAATTSAPTLRMQLGEQEIAYRVIGSGNGVPLLLLNRFRGTMDHWDPKLIDALAAQRPVLMFDQPGFGRSSGQPSDSLGAFAATATRVASRLGYRQVDVLGFSMGGTVALQLVLDHPGFVRRAVIAGSGPGHVPIDAARAAPPDASIWQVATKPVNDHEDFLFLFFEATPTSRAAGQAYLARLTARGDAFAKQVEPVAWQAQLRAAMAVGSPETSLLPRLNEVRQPVLVANGRHDVMVPTYASYAMAQELPNARLVIYPDSGHGFLFQYPEAFSAEVNRFLEER
ncbi:alpha/beta hydrolase [Variovorax sp. J22P168]|uniref:alpha/beta fold hydrolase n=1 Tax=Variovorax jilinensis TaxID=3053513 RepID=UPI0025762953|nr:alpha/beta hydrolase [Variovorax sp. J22P168]MDM0015927.1 alpha/beta hydrolase [Variovorax sp. J22P168]